MSRKSPTGISTMMRMTYSEETLSLLAHDSGGSANAVPATHVTSTAGRSARTRAARRTAVFSRRLVTRTG
jgi:hypothetical protein